MQMDIDILDAGAIALDIATPWITASLYGEDEDIMTLPSGNEKKTGEYIPPCP